MYNTNILISYYRNQSFVCLTEVDFGLYKTCHIKLLLLEDEINVVQFNFYEMKILDKIYKWCKNKQFLLTHSLFFRKSELVTVNVEQKIDLCGFG